LAALGDAVREGMARYHVPGVALGVLDGEAEWVAGFGLTRLDRPLPVDEATPFPVASITKTLVATAVMRLVERGQVALDQPLRAYLPHLRLGDPQSTDRLTLLHLLTHTGGFQGDVGDGAYGVVCGDGDDALARFVGMMALLPQHAPPGEVWAYNNVGFTLAGRVLEVVTGKTFESAVRDLVLEPLGMHRARFLPAEPIGDDVAAGHVVKRDRVEVARRWALPRILSPAGGLVCSAGELLRYARFHLEDGRVDAGQRLLSPASMALMQAPRAGGALHNGCLASFADDVGLSWFSRATAQGRIVVHGGWTSLSLRLTLVPARRFGIFVLTNADMGAQLHAEVTKQALHDFTGIDGLDAEPLPVPPADPALYAGTYRFTAPDEEDVDVRVDGGGLTLTDIGPAAFYAPDHIVALTGLWRHERGHFVRGPDGQIAYLRIGGVLGRRLHTGEARLEPR
jgi:CubicO group peptidase (beta-lactamase class C family)